MNIHAKDPLELIYVRKAPGASSALSISTSEATLTSMPITTSKSAFALIYCAHEIRRNRYRNFDIGHFNWSYEIRRARVADTTYAGISLFCICVALFIMGYGGISFFEGKILRIIHCDSSFKYTHLYVGYL